MSKYFSKLAKLIFLGSGMEGAAYRDTKTNKVIKQLHSDASFEELQENMAHAKSNVLNPHAKVEWPELIKQDDKVFAVSNYVEGERASRFLNKDDYPKNYNWPKVSRRLIAADPDYLSSDKWRGSYPIRVSTGGLTLDEAKATNKFIPDAGVNNWIVNHKEEMVNIDPGFAPNPVKRKELIRINDFLGGTGRGKDMVQNAKFNRIVRKLYQKDYPAIKEFAKTLVKV